MTPATAARTGIGATLARLRRWLGRWWILQPAARQDRLVTIGPLVSVLLFLAAIISAFWYLRNEEIERETDSLKRDTELVQQQLRLKLIENQEQLLRIATELSRRDTDIDEFAGQAAAFIRDRPAITQIAWLDADRQRRTGRFANPFRGEAVAGADPDNPALPRPGQDTPAEQAFARARDLRQPVYSRAYTDEAGSAVFQVQVPLVARNTFVGTLLAEYSIEALLRHYVPPDVAGRHRMELIDDQRRLLASTVTAMPGHDETRRIGS